WQQLCISPDGKQVVTASPAGIHVWDIASGGRLRTLAREDYFLVRYSPNGDLVAAVDRDWNHAVLLDANTGQRLWSWSIRTHQLVDIAFTADGKNLIVAGKSTEQLPLIG